MPTICPNKNDAQYKALKDKVGEIGADTVWDALGGISYKIDDFLKGKISPSEINKGNIYTNEQLKGFLIGKDKYAYTEENKDSIVQNITSKIKVYPIDSEHRKYYNRMNNEYVYLKDVSDEQVDKKIAAIVDELIANEKSMGNLASWVAAGSVIENAKNYFGKSKYHTEQKLNHLKAMLNIVEGDRAYTLKEYSENNNIPLSDFFSKNIVIVEHLNKTVSVYDFTSDSFYNVKDGGKELFSAFYENSNDAKLQAISNELKHGKSKHGFNHFNNAMLLAYLKHNNPSVNFHRAAIVQMSQGITMDLIDMNKTIPYLKYINNFKFVKDKMPVELYGVFENKDLYDFKNYGFEWMPIIMNYFKNQKIGEATPSTFILEKSLGDIGSDFNRVEVIEALKFYITMEQGDNNTNPDVLLNNDLYIAASEALIYYTNSIKSVGTNKLDGDYKGRIAELHPLAAIDNELFQEGRKAYVFAERKISRMLIDFSEKNLKLMQPVIDLFKIKRGIPLLSKIKDDAGNIFKDMFIDVKALNSEGKSVSVNYPMIHYTLNNPLTKEAFNSGKIKQEHLDYGKFVVDKFKEIVVENIKHKHSFDSARFYKNGKLQEKELNDFAEMEFNRMFPEDRLGFIPVVSKTAFESMTQDGDFKGAFKKWFDNVTNPNKNWDQDFNDVESGKYHTVADRFERQYDSNRFLEQIGLSLDNGVLTLVDAKKNADMSHDISNTMHLLAVSSYRKTIYEKDVLPYINSVLSLLKKKKEGQDSKNDDLIKLVEKFKRAVIHGEIDKNIGNFFGMNVDNILLTVKKAMSNTLILNTGVSISSFVSGSLGIMSKAIQGGITNSRYFTMKEYTEVGKMFMEFFNKPDINNNFTKITLLVKEYQVGKWSADDLILLPEHQKQKEVLFQSHYGHYLNWAGDTAQRVWIAIAQMKKDGLWDAYTLVENKDGEIVLKFDETKVDRFKGDNGKLIRDSVYADLVQQGLQDPNEKKLSRGYDEKEAYVLKAIADQYVLGAFTKDSKALANYDTQGALMMSFRNFLPTRIINKFGRTHYNSDLAFRTVIETKDGKKEVVFQNPMFEGQLNSLKGLFNEAMIARKEVGMMGMTQSAWKKLPNERRENIVQLMIDIGLSTSLLFFYGLAFGDDDDEALFQENRYSRSFKYGILDMVSLLQPTFYSRLLDNPIPAFDMVKNLEQAIFEGQIEKAYRYTPLYSDVKGVKEIIESTNE